MTNLSAHFEAIALGELGPPHSKRGTEWRYGTHGSLSLCTRKGVWFDHEANEGGGITKLIARQRGTTMESISTILEREYGVQRRSQEALTPKKYVEARFDYYGPDGDLIFQVERYHPKTFRQRRPDGKGGWLYNLQGVTQVPYNLVGLIQNPDAPVYVVEGEKAAEALISVGQVATTNAGGSANWKPDLNKHFEGRRVIVLPDNDDAGQKHADVVVSQLYGVAAAIKRVDLPGLEEKGDVFDWLARGNTIDDLHRIIKDTPVISDEPPEAKPKSRALQTLDMNQLINMPPVDWLVDGMITAHGFSVIYGAPGIGKSFLSIDLSLTIAYGDQWHGRATKRGGVLYIAGEGVGGMGNRVKAWMHHNGKEEITDFHVVPQTVKMLEAEGVEAVIETIDSFDVEFRLIVIDTLARTLAATGNDENSATDTGLLIEQCNEIQRRCGVAVLAVAHSGKDSSRGLRGSSAVLGGADTVIGMTGGDGLATIKMEKQKDAQEIEPMSFMLQPIALVEDSSAVLVPTEHQVKDKQGKRLSPTQRLVYEALQTEIIDSGNSGIPKAQWEAACRRDIPDGIASSLSTARKEAQEKGFVKIRKGLVYINKRLDE
jgi:hypothetical protein